MTIATRRLGKTGQDVTMLGLGGEGVLRTFGRDRDAAALINRALDLGIAYCESARAYSGSESYYGKALRERRETVRIESGLKATMLGSGSIRIWARPSYSGVAVKV